MGISSGGVTDWMSASHAGAGSEEDGAGFAGPRGGEGLAVAKALADPQHVCRLAVAGAQLEDEPGIEQPGPGRDRAAVLVETRGPELRHLLDQVVEAGQVDPPDVDPRLGAPVGRAAPWLRAARERQAASRHSHGEGADRAGRERHHLGLVELGLECLDGGAAQREDERQSLRLA